MDLGFEIWFRVCSLLFVVFCLWFGIQDFLFGLFEILGKKKNHVKP